MLVKRVERRILESGMEPPSKSWLWLDLTSGVPVLKNYMNGKWTPLAGSSEDKPEPEPTDLTGYAKESWVVSRINSLSAFFNTKLSDYVKKSELPEIPDIQGLVADIADVKSRLSSFITLSYFNVELGKFSNSLSTTYQKKLTAGAGINIDGNNVIKSTLVIDKALSGTSTNPIENKAVKAAFDSIQSDIDDINDTLDEKENKLIPGDNISLSTAPSGGTVISASIMAPPGSEQVQASWTQTDNTSPDYIKNKPDLDTLFNAKQDVLVSGTNIKTINNHSLLGNGNITISGGSGSGSSVDVVEEGDDTSDNNTLYFFSPSPLQAEGLYNNLLQNGSENGIVYNPGTLYRICDSGEFCTESQDNITIENNCVYCCGQMTTMKHYGDVVLSNSLKYAETSDTARILFTVAGPFHADKTRVAVNYDESKVQLEYRRVSLSTWNPVPNSGYMFDFYSNLLQDSAVLLRVIRFKGASAGEPYGDRLETTITFDNGYESVSMHIVFPKCMLFYKEGASDDDNYNGFKLSTVPELRDGITLEGPEQEHLFGKNLWWVRSQVVVDGVTKHNAYAEYSGNRINFKGNQIGSRKRAMRVGSVHVDQGTLNIFYVVVDFCNTHNAWLQCTTFDITWDGRNNANNDYIWYNSTHQLGTAGDGNIGTQNNAISLWGSHVIRCFIQDIHTPSPKDLSLYLLSAYNGSYLIKEIGLLTY